MAMSNKEVKKPLEIKDLNDVFHYLAQIQEELEIRGYQQAALHVHKSISSLNGAMLLDAARKRTADKANAC
jgi:hypothetical protein